MCRSATRSARAGVVLIHRWRPLENNGTLRGGRLGLGLLIQSQVTVETAAVYPAAKSWGKLLPGNQQLGSMGV